MQKIGEKLLIVNFEYFKRDLAKIQSRGYKVVGEDLKLRGTQYGWHLKFVHKQYRQFSLIPNACQVNITFECRLTMRFS